MTVCPTSLPEPCQGGELVEDLDDDGDGALDLSETGTGIYNGAGDLGTDSLNPDTDGDGICDGPNAVPPICLAGPDSNPVGTGLPVRQGSSTTPRLSPHQPAQRRSLAPRGKSHPTCPTAWCLTLRPVSSPVRQPKRWRTRPTRLGEHDRPSLQPGHVLARNFGGS